MAYNSIQQTPLKIVSLATKLLFFISLHENETELGKKQIRERRIKNNA